MLSGKRIVDSERVKEQDRTTPGVSHRAFSTIPPSEDALSSWDLKVDVAIAGSGAAALSAALTASLAGLVPLIVESSDKWGGTTAKSGGGVWVPNNPLMCDAGINDSVDIALSYLESSVGDVGPSSSLARRRAYLEAGPQMIKAFQASGFKWSLGAHYPDYHYDCPGARIGRMLEGSPFDVNLLGPWRDNMRRRDQFPMIPIMCDEMSRMLHASRTRTGFIAAVYLVGRIINARLRGCRPATMGMSLVAQLMYLIQCRGVAVWLKTALCELIMEGGRVVGAIIERDGRRMRVRADRGVMLGVGGFARNDTFRKQYQQPVDSTWSIAIPEDRGDGLRLGLSVDAQVAMMNESWWVPMIFPPGEPPNFIVWERTVPGSIMVNSSGKRFVNEAASYQDVGSRMLEVGAVPSWLIIDATHRRRYPIGMALPGITPRRWLRESFIIKAPTLVELAYRCKIDSTGLRTTVERFNEMAAAGVDEDFHRGATEYDRYYGDPTHSPNPTLGPLQKGPFYAIRIYPGDVGSKGGLLIDEHARVVAKNGSPIPGLYAAGNTSATLMGHRYPGPGSTIGSALICGYIAMRHAKSAVVTMAVRTSSSSPASNPDSTPKPVLAYATAPSVSSIPSKP